MYLNALFLESASKWVCMYASGVYSLEIAIHCVKPVRVNMGYHFNMRFIQIRFYDMCVKINIKQQPRMKKLRTCPKITSQTSTKNHLSLDACRCRIHVR